MTAPWEGKGIHRGIGVSLPDDLHEMVHNPAIPARQRAQALHDYVRGQQGGTGIHWTTSPAQARSFGEDNAAMATKLNAVTGRKSPGSGTVKHGTSVVLHAASPEPDNVDDSLPDSAYSYRNTEREVPLVNGDLADVRGISWRRQGDRDSVPGDSRYTYWNGKLGSPQ